MHERLYCPGKDDAALLSLRAKVWGADHPHTNPAFFKWLFQDNPNGEGSGIVKIRDDTIIGFAGFIPRPCQAGEQTLKMAHGLEFMVDPETMRHLNRVPFQLMAAHNQRIEEAGNDFAINFPNDSSVRMLTSKHVGYQQIFEPQLMVRPLPGFSFLTFEKGAIFSQIFKICAANLASVYSTLVSLRFRKDIQIEELQRFDDRFDDLNKRLARDGKIRLNRDSKTLNWRFCQHPIYQYQKYAAIRQGQLVGYIVMSPRQLFNTKAGLICDLSVEGNDPLVIALLVNALYKKKEDKISILVDQQIPGSAQMRALTRCGFFKIPPAHNPKQFRMVARVSTDRGEIAFHPDKWAFSWGDMDVV
ncbi:hypothetical protein [Sneathiella aquimaris]|uniref:hypothetical protein n=1 Tax=Sneathiella aquimaris TaxID=2599305 RepID=UPI00146B9785|nr:hypothetical protein [Sneathiella aquimaris]